MTLTLLDVELPEPLDRFYQEVQELFAAGGVTVTCERQSGPEFGGFYWSGQDATVGIREDLPDDAFRHTLAHELAHGLQRREGWPRVSAEPSYSDEDTADEIAAMVQAIVHCPAAEMRIAPLGLDPSWEQRERHQNVRAMLRAPNPEANRRGSPSWAYWSLLHAFLMLMHPAEHSRALLHNFERAIPAAAEMGRDAAALVLRHGYATSDQARASLDAVRAAMGLEGMVTIRDPREEPDEE